MGFVSLACEFTTTWRHQCMPTVASTAAAAMDERVANARPLTTK